MTTPTPQQIETAARALAEAHGFTPDAFPTGWRTYVPMATAALSAALAVAPALPDRATIARALDEANSNFAPDPEDDEDGHFHRWSSALADAVLATARTEAQVGADALRNAADEYGPGQLTFFGTPQAYTRAWLRARADQLEAGGHP